MTTVTKPNPLQAAKRTAVAMSVAAIPVLLGLAQFLTLFVETYKDTFPVEILSWAAGAAAFLILTSSFLTGVMNIPVVDAWLAKVRLEFREKEVEVVEPFQYQPMVEIPDYPTKQ